MQMGRILIVDFLNRSNKLNIMLAPLPHQSDAICFIREQEREAKVVGSTATAAWALLDQMGLGKTLSLMYTIRSDLGTIDAQTGDVPHTLIVAPACVRNQYKDRIALYGIGAITTFISYTGLTRNNARTEKLKNKKWYRVVLDEAHLIHNARSRRFVACGDLQSRVRGVLTGTPLLRKVSDLTTIASWLRISPDELKGATLRRTFADVQDTLPTNLQPTALELHEHVYERRSHVAFHQAAVSASKYDKFNSFRVGERIASLRHDLIVDDDGELGGGTPGATPVRKVSRGNQTGAHRGPKKATL